MKILKLLNKKSFSIIFIFLLISVSHAEDKPVDIWNIDSTTITQESSTNDPSSETYKGIQENTITDIYKMQSQKNSNSIELDTNLNTQEIKIIGLYDQRIMVWILICGQIQMEIN